MSSVDNAGRISKNGFLGTTTALFAIVVVSFFVRLYIRLFVQKQFGIDDAFICFGVMCLISAMGILYHMVNDMYLAEAFLLRSADIGFSTDLINRTFDYQMWAAVTLTLNWFAITSVKMSYLFLFRKLVDRIRSMTIYWWVVLTYTVVVALYGITAFFVPCPYFRSFQAITCSEEPRTQFVRTWSSVQMGLDILGDFLILAIPVYLIYKIQIKLSQKIALSFSLCLTIFMIVITIVRLTGVMYPGTDYVDALFEEFCLYLSAEVGLIMSTVTAFRTFFISQGARKRHPNSPEKYYWYKRALSRLQLLLSSAWHRTTGVFSSSGRLRSGGKRGFNKNSYYTSTTDSDGSGDPYRNKDLPDIPRAHMTGIRTFIGRAGRTTVDTSQIMRTQTVDVENWPLYDERPGFTGAYRTEVQGAPARF